MLKPVARLVMKAGIRRRPSPVGREFLPWDRIRSMAIIIGSGEQVNKSAIDSFIKSTGKHVEVYYIELSSARASFADWHCFSRKHRNMLRLPVKRVQDELRFRKYDVVINACDGSYLFPAAVAALITAPFKCAVSDLLGYANLEVRRAVNQDLFRYLEDVKKYLQMIRTGA
jgi:hypothetical protein